VSLRARNWPRTVRNVLARQVLFTGVEATRFISLIAFAVGLVVVAQAQLWTGKVGQARLLGPILVTVIIRELAPVLANFVVIGRSGNAIAAELSNMTVSGEVRVLDAQGLDPLTYLVMPRVLGMMIAVFCLTVVMIFMSLFSGYLFSALVAGKGADVGLFLESIAGAIRPVDLYSVLAKTLVPSLLSAVIACTEGLSVEPSVTEVPRATTRSLERSMVTLFITTALISALTYL
jgi:phospholipid/cholesterol/gamma-HCH transport system permease protein